MSDTTPSRTPSSVERMSATSAKSGGGMGGMMTMVLAVACIVLMVACFYLFSGKREAQSTVDKQMTEINDIKGTLSQREATVANLQRDNATLRATNATSIPLSQFPAGLGNSAGEVAMNIRKMFETTRVADAGAPGRPGTTPPLTQADSPAAWVENIARQLAKGSINTKEATGNDASKVQMHKGIQIVMTKVGAFNKAPTGNATDTYDAVVAFQKANKLTADGIIGKGTWGKVRERMEATAHAGQ